jgi:hypothetical protein
MHADDTFVEFFMTGERSENRRDCIIIRCLGQFTIKDKMPDVLAITSLKKINFY